MISTRLLIFCQNGIGVSGECVFVSGSNFSLCRDCQAGEEVTYRIVLVDIRVIYQV